MERAKIYLSEKKYFSLRKPIIFRQKINKVYFYIIIFKILKECHFSRKIVYFV